ncbi:hypothetical protein D3C72_2477300 [compost metagenome]
MPSISACAMVSTPSATVSIPSERAISMIDRISACSVRALRTGTTSWRSIFSRFGLIFKRLTIEV